MSNKHTLWVEAHRPKNLKEYIFHDKSQQLTITKMINEGSVPHLLLSGVQGSGKAQPLDAQILTPSGWVTMGDIQPGQYISTPDGDVAEVVNTFPQGTKDIYSITFHDGSSTECCLDHLWECYFVDNYKDRKATKHIVDTRTIIQYMDKQAGRKTEKFNISIPLITPKKSDICAELPIDAYLLGVILGDGSILESSPRLTTIDEDVITNCEERLYEGYVFNLIKNTHIEYILSNSSSSKEQNLYTKYLIEMGLHGKKSHQKFIPDQYKKCPNNQKWDLIQGLMDTDGTISKKGNSISYVTTSHQLAYDIQEILWSLGCTCTITTRTPSYSYNGIKKQGKLAFTLHINHNEGSSQFFKLNRKKERGHSKFAFNHSKGDNIQLRRRIVSVDYVGQKEAKCIKVDHPDELYITDDYIVTHNTTLSHIIVNELDINDMDVLTINASDENSIDVMREKIKTFVTTFAMGKFKIVQLEEADYISHNGQAMLRHLIEEYSETARFILTCNYENKIIPAIKSRCQHFRFTKHDINQVTEYVAKILLQEKVTFDLGELDKYVRIGYPDIRNIINSVQQYTIDGQLLPLTDTNDSGDYKFKLLTLIEEDKWNEARSVLSSNVTDEEWIDVYRFLYDNLDKSKKFSTVEKWQEGIVAIADHLYRDSLVADREINATAMLIKLATI